MDKEFKTTFIPKKNLAQSTPQVKRTSKGKSIIGFVAFLLFITAVVSSIGVYVYKVRVATVMNSRNESIKKAGKAFEPTAILALKKLDIRLQAATELLDQHIALSDFFGSFAESTLPSVAYNDFSFTYTSEGSPEIQMTGDAKTYLAIAQQSELYEKNRFIENHIFSDFALNDVGSVAFSLDFTLKKDLLRFGRTSANDQLEGEDVDEAIIPGSTGVQNTGVPVNF